VHMEKVWNSIPHLIRCWIRIPKRSYVLELRIDGWQLDSKVLRLWLLGKYYNHYVVFQIVHL
jgi:hypothetical protein